MGFGPCLSFSLPAPVSPLPICPHIPFPLLASTLHGPAARLQGPRVSSPARALGDFHRPFFFPIAAPPTGATPPLRDSRAGYFLYVVSPPPGPPLPFNSVICSRAASPWPTHLPLVPPSRVAHADPVVVCPGAAATARMNPPVDHRFKPTPFVFRRSEGPPSRARRPTLNTPLSFFFPSPLFTLSRNFGGLIHPIPFLFLPPPPSPLSQPPHDSLWPPWPSYLVSAPHVFPSLSRCSPDVFLEV